MAATSIDKDHEALVMTLTTELDAPIERAWQLWADPRQLERWWGPPSYPATFVDHDLTPEGRVTYFMTGPEGDQHHGWWRVLTVDAPDRLQFEDGFADQAGDPAHDMPTTITWVRLDEIPGGGTRMTLETKFPSPEAMNRMISMGMEEGITLAVGQIDGILETDITQR